MAIMGDVGQAELRKMRSLLLAGLVIFTAVAFTAQANASRPLSACFVHLGPQDKPMPEFCMVPKERPANEHKPDRPDVVLTANALQGVIDLCRRRQAPASEDLLGTYRVSTNGAKSGTVYTVGPKTMRELIGIVQGDFRRRGEVLPEILLRLQHRLAKSG